MASHLTACARVTCGNSITARFDQIPAQPWMRLRRACGALRSMKSSAGQGGQAVVEMTLGFLLFFTIFFAVVEFSHLLYSKVTLQHALGKAGRYMITGRTASDPEGNPRPRPAVVREVFCRNVIATGLRCPDLGPDFEFTCLDAPCSQPGGGPNQTVMLTVRLSKPAMMPFFSQFFTPQGVPFELSTTWRNEPFPST